MSRALSCTEIITITIMMMMMMIIIIIILVMIIIIIITIIIILMMIMIIMNERSFERRLPSLKEAPVLYDHRKSLSYQY